MTTDKIQIVCHSCKCAGADSNALYCCFGDADFAPLTESSPLLVKLQLTVDDVLALCPVPEDF